MIKKIFCLFLCVVTFSVFGLSACGASENKENEKESLSGTKIEIVKDTQFSNGFGASWNYGTAFTGTELNKNDEMFANQLKKGYVRDYEDIRDPFYNTYKSLYLIPYGRIWEDCMPSDEDDIYWCFEEGYHKNFTDIYGNFIDELHAHKL